MNQLLFITSNQNKLKEVREILSGMYEILSLADISYVGEIEEPYDTIRANAIHKAEYFFNEKQLACIAEDSGLEVDALHGKPGAYSARYAGDEKNDYENLSKVLREMSGIENRTARFRSVFVYKDQHVLEVFEGHMNGRLIDSPKGQNGFGYDPIFIADGQDKTNAELTSEEKNQISHRKKALKLLIDYVSSRPSLG